MSAVHEEPSGPNIGIAVNALTSAGFLLEGATRNPGYLILHTRRYDEFGLKQGYCFLVAEGTLTDDHIEGAKIAAKQKVETLVIVGGGSQVEEPHIEWHRFINMFGGPIGSLDPLDVDFTANLQLLGRNQLPKGLSGKADELFEVFTHRALEFILGGRVVRYGQARRFEQRPDGLAIPNPHFSALYDAKAYSDGYKVTAATMRQFESYVRDFDDTYSAWYRLNCFIVVSGSFPHKEKTLRDRSKELLAASRVPLSFVTAEALSRTVELMKDTPLVRRSINWAKVFSSPTVSPTEVEKQIDSIKRDNLIM